MFRFGFWWRLFLALLLIGLLAVGGVALYRLGWAQGYQASALATSNGSQTAPLPPAYYYPYPFFGFAPFFFPFGLFACIGGFLLIFFLFGGLFRFWGWRHWSRNPGRGGWGYGPFPPGVHDWRERYKAPSEKGGGAAGTPPEVL